MKATLTRVQRARPPRCEIDSATMREAGEIAKESIRTNVDNGQTADGIPLKSNAPSTAEQKGGSRPLIGKNGRILNGLRVVVSGDSVGVEPSSDEVRRIIGYVAAKGYVGWFGVSAEARERIFALLRKQAMKR